MPLNQEGRAAFYRGVALEDAPYDDAVRRIPWRTGWCDSKRDVAILLAAQELSPRFGSKHR